MGIFSDRCEALIDSSTGVCLSGEALTKAKADKHWPRCRNIVKKAARGCSKCGSPAPGGWTKCPACSKWIGVESRFCWNCQAALHPEDHGAMAAGHWQKQAGVMAKRLDVGDIKQFLHTKNRIIVEAGSAAILLQGGECKDLLKPGTHTLDSLAHRINNWGDPPPRTIVLVDAGDIVVPICVEDLRTSEDIPVQLYAEVAIRIAHNDKAARAFMTNVMKDAREMGYEGFVGILTQEIRYAVVNICNTGTVEDLFKNPERRMHIEDELESVLKKAADRYGFEVVRLASAEFTGKAYEELREKSGETELKRRQLEFDATLRDVLLKDKMHQFKSNAELEDYVRQLAQDKQVKDEHRDQEIALLQLVRRQELSAKEAAFAMAREMEKATHEIGVKIKWDKYTTAAMLDKAKAEADETRIWLAVRAEKEKLKREDQAAQIKMLEGKDLQTLLAVLPEERHASLLKLNEQMMRKGLSGKDILFAEAGKNPDLARALLEMERTSRTDREKDWEDRKELLEKQADRMERIMKEALDAAAKAAQGRGNSTQIVK